MIRVADRRFFPMAVDLLTQRFTRLVVTRCLGINNHALYWLADCDCGKQVRVSTGSLRSGRFRSCGCLRKETLRGLVHKMNDREAESKRIAAIIKELDQ